MSEISIGKEFLELAIEIEKNGRLFYEHLDRQDRDKEISGLFTQIAMREREHENSFRDMFIRLGGYRPQQKYAGEHYEYIKNLAASSIFTGERAQRILAQKTMTDIEAMEVAIGIEKDCILLYSEIRGMVPQLDQDIIDMIISEEKKHLSEFTYRANRLREGK